MTEGTSQGLFVVVAIVIFGIFIGLTYTIFGSEGLSNDLKLIFEDSIEQVNNTNLISKYYGKETITITDEKYFVFDTPSQTITEYTGTETDIVIPYEIDGKLVTTIGENAFKSKGLTSVEIPATVETIKDGTHWSNSNNSGAFKGNLLTNIKIPDSVEHIGIGAFADNQLVSVTLPKNIKRLETDVFRNNKITDIKLPEKLEYIGPDSFEKNSIVNIVIPDSVKIIDYCAFNLNKLQTITLNEGLESIGSSAFASNLGVKSVIFPSTLKSIATHSFHSTSLTSVVLSINTTFAANSFGTTVTIYRK